MGLEGKGALRNLRDRVCTGVRAVLRNSRRAPGLGKNPGIGIWGFQSDPHLRGAPGGGSWLLSPAPGWEHGRAWNVLLPQGKEPWAGPGESQPEKALQLSLDLHPPCPTEPQIHGMCLELGKAPGSVWVLLIQQQPAGILDNGWKILCPSQRFPRVVPGGTQPLGDPGGIQSLSRSWKMII